MQLPADVVQVAKDLANVPRPLLGAEARRGQEEAQLGLRPGGNPIGFLRPRKRPQKWPHKPPDMVFGKDKLHK